MRRYRTSSLRLSLRHLQTFLAPDPFRPLVIHSPAFPLQQSRYPRAQKFPEAASFRMALSRACSATSFFNRAFSFSNSFSPLAWGHTKTAVFPALPVIGLLGDPQRLADLSHPLPIVANSTSAWRSLWMTCSGVKRFRLITAPFLGQSSPKAVRKS